jgi:hypothetical protein
MEFNRVKDFYTTIIAFYALSPMARYVIGTSFALIKYEEYILNPDTFDDIIFERVISKNRYREFRHIVQNHRSLYASSNN